MSVDPKSFLPQFSCQTVAGGAIGMYKLFEEEEYKYLFDRQTKRAIVFSSASEAIKAAKAHVLKKLNPHIRTDVEACAVEIDKSAEIMAIKDWEERKRDETAVAHYMKRRSTMRPVVVEHKIKRGRA